jgi:hypothetical protein
MSLIQNVVAVEGEFYKLHAGSIYIEMSGFWKDRREDDKTQENKKTERTCST